LEIYIEVVFNIDESNSMKRKEKGKEEEEEEEEEEEKEKNQEMYKRITIVINHRFCVSCSCFNAQLYRLIDSIDIITKGSVINSSSKHSLQNIEEQNMLLRFDRSVYTD
jgi:hypothetical protein